jgi:hypothetical protein
VSDFDPPLAAQMLRQFAAFLNGDRFAPGGVFSTRNILLQAEAVDQIESFGSDLTPKELAAHMRTKADLLDPPEVKPAARAGKKPIIETTRVAGTLRYCVDLLTAAREGADDDETRGKVDDAIAEANAQADALDAIKDQTFMPVYGDSPFEMKPIDFPLPDGRTVPALAIKEESGDLTALGFSTPEAAKHIGAGIMALGLAYAFAADHGDESKH